MFLTSFSFNQPDFARHCRVSFGMRSDLQVFSDSFAIVLPTASNGHRRITMKKCIINSMTVVPSLFRPRAVPGRCPYALLRLVFQLAVFCLSMRLQQAVILC